LLLATATAASRIRAAEAIDFAHDVLPLLKSRCVKCHANGRQEGDFSIDTREDILKSGDAEPGHAADSELIRRVTSNDPEERMPAKADPLTAAEVDVLRRWIEAGLPWQSGFTFKQSAYEPPLEPRRPELPPAEAGVDNPIDRIIFHYWKEHGLTPPPAADDATFIRRASLDLTGLLPMPDQTAAFVADRDPQKRRVLVSRLLDDRVAYADHWLTFWNDLLRNDYAGVGYIDGGRKQITAWLYRSLLENKPYDQFVRELIAPTTESAGFSKGIVWRGNVNASQRPEMQFSQNISQVFLGINMKCASCHDSFVDNWKLTDSYGLAAIIAEKPLELNRCDKPTGQMAKVHFMFPQLGSVDADAPRDARLRQLAALMTHPQNGRLTRTIVNRLWHRLVGRGIVHPVDAMNSPPWSADLLDELAVDLSDHDYDLKSTLALIATSQAYGAATVAWDEQAPAEDYVFAGPAPKRMTAEEFVDALASITGVAPAHTKNDEIFVKSLETPQGRAGDRPFVRASLVEATPLMRTLGRPNREQIVTTRPAEITTLEALELSNGQSLAELLHAGAEKLLAAHRGMPPQEMYALIVRSALSREPMPEEVARLAEIAGDPLTPAGLSDALWCVVMLPEFQIVR
jgi:hypothetical protein